MGEIIFETVVEFTITDMGKRVVVTRPVRNSNERVISLAATLVFSSSFITLSSHFGSFSTVVSYFRLTFFLEAALARICQMPFP
jgi:hypothetical protein